MNSTNFDSAFISNYDGTQGVASNRKVEVKVNVYDLLPPGRLATFLWNVGGAVLHSGVVVGKKEYAFGGHNKAGVSGVYWTAPGLVPPGGTFRCEMSMGYSRGSIEHVDRLIKETSHEFLGPTWNLLTNNCNHFTSYLCEQLTGNETPTWLNRAASIGISMPCLIPKQWLSPPDAETADGELIDAENNDDDDNDDDDEEHTAMLNHQRGRRADVDDAPDFVYQGSSDGNESDESFETRRRRRRRVYRNATKSNAVADIDSNGRVLPVSERAPVAQD